MTSKLSFSIFLMLLSISLASDVPFPGCTGQATYKVTFFNFLTPDVFGKLIPSDGLKLSPLTATSHSNRVSILTVRGFPSPEIEEVAETGDNGPLLALLRRLRRQEHGVKTIAGAAGPTLPGRSTTLTVRVDCKNPFISAVSMIAPSPDWIVQINNVNVFSEEEGKFIRFTSGKLIAYDAGTDSGGDFTDPSDPSLDIETVPQKNIAPLVEDETDPFEGRVVGKFFIRMES